MCWLVLFSLYLLSSLLCREMRYISDDNNRNRSFICDQISLFIFINDLFFHSSKCHLQRLLPRILQVRFAYIRAFRRGIFHQSENIKGFLIGFVLLHKEEHIIISQRMLAVAALRATSSLAFRKTTTTTTTSIITRTMVTITEGVEFDTVAREWRCKVRLHNKKI